MMDSDRQTERTVRKEDLKRCEEILDNLIKASEKHSVTQAKETFSEWRNQVQELTKRLEDPPETKIAVFGTTGDGKSSLLNAIFDEPDLLPTSGMGDACTSVVIKVETVQEDQEEAQTGYQAEITFLTSKEWGEEISFLKNNLVANKNEEIHKDVEGKLTALYGENILVDLGELEKAIIKRTDIHEKLGTTMSTDKYSTALELRKNIEDYIIVTDDGHQYWPIVKRVVIRMFNPRFYHQGVVFLDLPGIGDSNPVRVKMAEEERVSATILLAVTKISRCKASPTVESIIGEDTYIQMQMDQQKHVLVCTRTDDVDVDGAIKLMNPADKDVANRLDTELNECKRALEAVDIPDAEMGQLCVSEKKLCQQLLEKCASVRNAHIKDKLCKTTDTKVFCVSSMDYMKGAIKGYRGDKKPQVFHDIELTEIPKLRSHLEDEAAKSRREKMVNLQCQFGSITSDTHSFISNFNVTGKHHLAEGVSKELDKMNRSLKQVAEDMEKEIDDLFDQKLFTKIKEGATEARVKADATCASWGKSTDSGKALHLNTYRATVVRNGFFKTNNFNWDLAKPLLIKMNGPWEEVFGSQTWKDLMSDKVIHPATNIIQDHAAEIKRLLMDEQEGELHKNLDMIKNDAVSKLQNLKTVFQHIVERSQRSANRSIVSTVQEMMESTYKWCAKETGPGSYERMRQKIESHVKDHKERLFMGSVDALKKNLKEITVEVCAFIKDHLSHIHEDYLRQLHPLWMQTPVGQKYLEVLKNASRAIKKLLPSVDAMNRELGKETATLSIRKRSVPAPSSTHPKKNKRDAFDVYGSICFESISDEERAAAREIFNRNRNVIKKAFEDQDLEFLGWEKEPEFRVPNDFPTCTIQALVTTDWFPPNANIHIRLGPKVELKVVTSKNVQLGEHDPIPQGNSEDNAEVSIYSRDEDEIKMIFDAFNEIKKLVQSPYLSMKIQKMGSSSVTIRVTRMIKEHRSLYTVVKNIFHSGILYPLIASDTVTVTVTSNLFLSGGTDGTELRS